MPDHQPGGSHPMPHPLRLKLDACGEVLTPDQWAALPFVARRRLLQVPTGTPMERAAFTALLRWLLATFPPAP
jgi:hypothetical protein